MRLGQRRAAGMASLAAWPSSRSTSRRRARGSRRSARPLAFFDGPARHAGARRGDRRDRRVPAARQREHGRRVRHEPARTDALIDARQARSRPVPRLRRRTRSAFGANMTTLNFALTRTLGRELAAGDEIVVTRLDHDGNVAPWLELAHDAGSSSTSPASSTTLPARPRGSRAPALAADARRRVPGRLERGRQRSRTSARIVALRPGAGALAWVDAVHYAPHGPIDVREWDADVLLCSPYKFFGPHLGLAFGRARAARAPGGRTRCGRRPTTRSARRFETGRSSTSCSPASWPPSSTWSRIGWEAIRHAERELGERFLAGLPGDLPLYGPPSDGRPCAYLRVHASRARAAAEAAVALAERDLAVWHGNYYAVEIMRALGLDGGRRPRGHRPLQHGRRGRPPARGAGGAG